MASEDVNKNKASQESSEVEVIPDQPDVEVDENLQKAIDKELDKIRDENKKEAENPT